MLRRYNYPLALVLLTFSFIAAIALSTLAARADTSRTPLSSQIGPGSSGTDVRTLQTFLATNPLIYPEALVTGYYGPLTETAVAQFQIGYGLPPVGNVGPRTLARINSLIVAGAPIDVSAPQISNVAVARTSGTATISWTTNELAKGVVYYSATPVISYEISTALTSPAITGTPVAETGYTASHSIQLPGLQSGLTYYYVVESTDMTGNVSITLTGSFIAQ